MIWKALAPVILFFTASLVSGQDDLVGKSQRARQAMIDRQFDQAVRLYSELVQALPGNPGMLMNLGIALHSAGRYREALARFDAALKLQPDLTQAKLFAGMTHQKLGEPALAVALLSDVVKADPANTLARLELADALLSTGRFGPAVVHFRKLGEIDPKDARAWQGLALSYRGLGRRAFQALEKSAPDSAWMFALIAGSRLQQERFRAAFAFYQHALARKSDFPGIHAALAEVYRRTGHPDWAAVEEERERELPPPDCASAPARCLFAAGRYEDVIAMSGGGETLYWKSRSYSELALAALEKLAQIPPSPQIHELMAEAYGLQDQHRQAAAELREALRLDPGNRRLQALLAGALWRSRDFEAARPLLKYLAAADPNSAELSFQMGDVLLQQEDAGNSIPWLEKALKIDPGLLPAHLSLARAYMRVGRPADAVGHFKAALSLDDDGSIHFQLSRAYERAGKQLLAEKALRQFEEVSRAKALRQKGLDEERQITAPSETRREN